MAKLTIPTLRDQQDSLRWSLRCEPATGIISVLRGRQDEGTWRQERCQHSVTRTIFGTTWSARQRMVFFTMTIPALRSQQDEGTWRQGRYQHSVTRTISVLRGQRDSVFQHYVISKTRARGDGDDVSTLQQGRNGETWSARQRAVFFTMMIPALRDQQDGLRRHPSSDRDNINTMWLARWRTMSHCL